MYDNGYSKEITPGIFFWWNSFIAELNTELGTIENMKIEHWQSQSEHQAKELDYSNMLGVCNGNAGHVQRDTTCDTHRGNSPLTINPLDAVSVK